MNRFDTFHGTASSPRTTGQIMLPGLLALNAFFGGLQSVAFPLVLDFAWTREIEDRLLAPISLPLVAVEKIAGSNCQDLWIKIF